MSANDDPAIALEEARRKLENTPAIFLSASVPEAPAHDHPMAERRRTLRTACAQRSAPIRIREAVGQICRTAFGRGYSIVFGGHPAITPMVLDVARRFPADPDRGSQTQHRAWMFQSRHFEDRLVGAAYDLADWRAGAIVWTPIAEDSDGEEARESRSLTLMRTEMVRVTDFDAAIFVGGMDGIFQENHLFREWNADAARIPIASTGGAVDILVGDEPMPDWLDQRFHMDQQMKLPHGVSVEDVTKNLAYPLVVRRIFDALQKA